MAFNAKDHLIQLGGKDYLEVKWRLCWLREDHPGWGIETELLQLDAAAIVKASVKDETGRVLATGHGMAKTGGGAKWAGREIEKAETAAIGRALAHAGIGTQFIDDETEGEGDHLADSPVERKKQGKKDNRQTTKTDTPVTFNATTGREFTEWAQAQFADLSEAGLIEALQRVAPDLLFIHEWPMSNQEAIAAIFAYQSDYDAKTIRDWFVNLKKIPALKNRKGDFFTEAQLDTFQSLALKLAE